MKKMKISHMLYLAFIVMMFDVVIIAYTGYYLMNNTEKNGNTLYESYGETQGNVGLGYAEFQNVKVQLRNVLYLYADDSSEQASA